MPHSHKAGSLKQKNKAHGGHGGHSSKRSMKRLQGGKVNAPGPNAKGSASGQSLSSKQQRIHQVPIIIFLRNHVSGLISATINLLDEAASTAEESP